MHHLCHVICYIPYAAKCEMVDKNKNVCIASIKMLSHYCLWIIIPGSVLTGSPYLKMRPGCFFSVAPCATQTLRNQILKQKDPARVVKGWVYENHGLGLKQTPSINCFAAHNQILIRSRGSHWVWSLNITTFDGLSWRLLLKCSETVPCKDELQLLGPRATSSFPMAKRLAMSRVFCLSGFFSSRALAPLLPGFTKMIPLYVFFVMSFIDGYCMLRSNFWGLSCQASDTEANDCPKSFSAVMNPLPI